MSFKYIPLDFFVLTSLIQLYIPKVSTFPAKSEATEKKSFWISISKLHITGHLKHKMYKPAPHFSLDCKLVTQIMNPGTILKYLFNSAAPQAEKRCHLTALGNYACFLCPQIKKVVSMIRKLILMSHYNREV